MIQIRRNFHQMNGESVDVLELWRTGDFGGAGEMILSVPLEPEEQVESLLEPDLTDTPYLNSTDREKAALEAARLIRGEEPHTADVMTPDGRKQVAEKMLDDLVRYHNAKASAFSQAKQDQYGQKEEEIRTQILELMGVDS